MISTTRDECGITTYMVTNDQGLCLIYTTDEAIAHFVDYHSAGIDPQMRLTVGGDPGTKKGKIPKWIFRRLV